MRISTWPLAVVVFFGLLLGGLVQASPAEAAATLSKLTVPKLTQSETVTITWTLKDSRGSSTYLMWDTRSRNSGAPRNQSATKNVTAASQNFTASVTIPDTATRMYFTVVLRTGGSTSQFSERTFSVTRGVPIARSVDEAEGAVALVIISGPFGDVGNGSAFIVGKDLLLTNEHVIVGAEDIDVVFSNGRRVNAEVVGYDAIRDIAAIRATTPSNAKRLEWDIAGREARRTDVWAWGYPGATVGVFGDEVAATITDGIISSYQTRNGVKYIQTNADINPGNSGGPLVTEEGRAIGIDSANLLNSDGDSASGLNLALSIADHRDHIRAVLGGARVENPQAQIADYLDSLVSWWIVADNIIVDYNLMWIDMEPTEPIPSADLAAIADEQIAITDLMIEIIMDLDSHPATANTDIAALNMAAMEYWELYRASFVAWRAYAQGGGGDPVAADGVATEYYFGTFEPLYCDVLEEWDLGSCS